MAFGRQTNSKRNKNAVLEDQLVRTYAETEDKTSKNWKNKWSWLLDEYDELHKNLQEISKSSDFLSNVNKNLKEEDTRSIKPIPDTTNHEYGWLGSRPEFLLDKYGPDYDPGPALPSKYRIFKGY